MSKRYNIFPIEDQSLWDRYKKAKSAHWDVEEVDLSQDKFEDLSEKEKEVLKVILAFFLVSDGLVLENLIFNILPDIPEEEAQYFYTYQAFNEAIHGEFYGLLIERYITDPKEKEFIYSPIENMETVRLKAEWALKWIEGTDSLAHKIVSFAVVEGLFFSSLFSTVFYFKDGGKLPGLCAGNLFINKDENCHYEFAVNYYKNYVKDKISDKELREIILDGYKIEKSFVKEMLKGGLPRLTEEMMVQYIQYVTDTVLVDFGLEKEFKVSQPLSYMDMISLETRSNFFEVRSTDYTQIEQSDELFDEDF